ncbi:hypothetical protein [Mesorhizobium sp. M0772]|uniref:hypothetical protein n=1 Tax=Mesorhizobium sp. M0772 TaxID=2956998 RepID=UPI00333CBC70
MTNSEQAAFADLVKQASVQPEPEIVTLTGVLWKERDPAKFCLTLGNGRILTLDISSVKSYLVLASSLGHTIVRVDVDPSQSQEGGRFLPLGWDALGKPRKDPIGDTYDSDPTQPYEPDQKPAEPDHKPDEPDGPDQEAWNAHLGSTVPFALATPRQAPSHVLNILQAFR